MKNKLIARVVFLSVFAVAVMTGCKLPEVVHIVPPEDRYADFTITGTVTDALGRPIPFITISGSWSYDDPLKNSPVATDFNGKYTIGNDAWKTGTLYLSAVDYRYEFNDGVHYHYRANYKKIEVNGNEYVGGDGKGYGGVYSKTVDFTLMRLGNEDEQK